jgi:predicted  nucleic acid-binding Zn-ribbon protein
MAKDCLYCGLQFADTVQFCPNCGRPTESGFKILPIQEGQKAELDRLRKQVKEKDDLIQQLARRWMREGAALLPPCREQRKDEVNTYD